MNTYEVIVVGLGAMGSASLHSLAKQGVNALGLEKFVSPHSEGSSHGESRITRWANGEGEFYQPFIKRSFELWSEIEEASSETLFHPSGGLIIAPKEGGAGFHGHAGFVELTQSIAQKYGVEHEILDANGIKSYAPMLNVNDNDHAYYSASSGILRPEKCIETQLELAQSNGAVVKQNEEVLSYSFTDSAVFIKTNKASYQAEKVIFTAGAWMQQFMPENLKTLLKVYRQEIFWFEADDLARFHHDKFPFVIWTKQDRNDYFCAFPVAEGGTKALKLMTEQYIESSDEPIKKTINSAEQQAFYESYVLPNIKGINNACLAASSCHYTLTPDEHFILDMHPDTNRIVLASPCSGHGFKFSAAIGECLAQLATKEESDIDITAFGLARFH